MYKRQNTRLKALRGYDYQPDNMATLLEKAKSAVEACRGYSEYASLNSKYQTYRTELYMLPTKAEYDAQNNHHTPGTTSIPQATATPMPTVTAQAGAQ